MDKSTVESKEDIVRNLCDGWVGGMTHGDEQRIVYPAMDEWARIRSIAFGKWLNDNYLWVNEQGFWYNKEVAHEGSEPFTIEELYELFIKETQTT